ncbi:MAG: hypothetical protein LBC77_01925 [Spirochaetaceae bacterium]|jgi:hypothetical protein|nr:hypothetical protein [Spirochaetaceae bacterium]
MENTNENGLGREAAELIRLFERELSELLRVEELQKKVEEAVYAKSWADFEGAEKQLAVINTRLAALEEERRALFPDNCGNFYLWAEALEAPAREEAMNVYRALKHQAARIQSASAAFTAYIRQMRRVVGTVLDAVFPERKLYGPYGKRRGADMRRVVLDKQF